MHLKECKYCGGVFKTSYKFASVCPGCKPIVNKFRLAKVRGEIKGEFQDSPFFNEVSA